MLGNGYAVTVFQHTQMLSNMVQTVIIYHNHNLPQSVFGGILTKLLIAM